MNAPTKNTLLVVADLRCLKAYKVDANQMSRTPRLELIEHYESPEAYAKVADRVTDAFGRFSPGAKSGPTADSERHNTELEQRKRLVRQLAARLNALAGKPEVEQCLLAASKEINRQLVEELHPQVRGKISRNLPSDLTKLGSAEILRYF